MDITVIKGFPVSSVVKNTPASAGDSGDAVWIPGSGRFPWRRKRQHIAIFLPGGHPVDRGAWWATVHSVTESDITEHTHTHTHTHP